MRFRKITNLKGVRIRKRNPKSRKNNLSRDIWLTQWFLQIHWRLSTILKTINKSVWSNGFRYVKVHILKIYSIHYTLRDNTTMSKKFPLDKINVTKKHSFFFRELQLISFTFDLQFLFLYKLKHMVYRSKLCVAFSIFDFVSFLLNFVFLFNKKHGFFDFQMS